MKIKIKRGDGIYVVYITNIKKTNTCLVTIGADKFDKEKEVLGIVNDDYSKVVLEKPIKLESYPEIFLKEFIVPKDRRNIFRDYHLG